MSRKCNQAGHDIIKSSEGFEPKAYYATEEEKRKKLLSIGYGFTYYADGSPIKKGDTMTREEADKLFDNHILAVYEDKVDKLVTSELTDNQFSALVSLCYNIGSGNLKNSTLLALVNYGKFKQAAEEFLKWDKQNKRVLKGLTDRRIKERRLFLS